MLLARLVRHRQIYIIMGTEIELPLLQADHPYSDYAGNMGAIRGDKRAFVVSADRVTVLSGNEPSIGFISPSNELDASCLLEAACSKQLRRFPTPIEERAVLMESNSLTLNLKNAERIRLGEKRVLQYFRGFAQSAIRSAPSQ